MTHSLSPCNTEGCEPDISGHNTGHVLHSSCRPRCLCVTQAIALPFSNQSPNKTRSFIALFLSPQVRQETKKIE